VTVARGDLGRVYRDGELFFRAGDTGDHMYVIQQGQVEVLVENDGRQTRVAVLGPGDILGEMAIFEREPRSATVRARGEVRAITVDRKNLLSRISEDPTLAFRLIKTLSKRVRDLNDEVARLRG
jgi:CRP/FNR family cyclic AMP-dependent transcriptional regulator